MPWKSVSFLHPRRVNRLVVFCLVSAEAVGEGEAGGGITGVFASHILTCPMVFGGDHHRAEDVVAVEVDNGIAAAEGITEVDVEIARGGEVHRALICLCAGKAVEGEREVVTAHKTEGGVG